MIVDVKELRRAMVAKNFSVTGLSEAAGVSTTTLNRWLNHGGGIQTNTLGRLARALDVDIYDIAKEDE